MDLKLYELTEQLRAQYDAIEEISEELIEQTAALIDQKCDGLVGYTESLKDQAELVKKRRVELQDLERRINKKIDNFKEYIKMCMDRASIKKIESPFSRITIGKARKSLYVKEEIVPEEYTKTEIKIDTDKIRKALDAGEKLDFASYVDGKESVLIKWK